MATLLLSAAGAAVGGVAGSSFLGLTTAALGKAAGAYLGSLIDRRILGLGAEPVETGRVDRLRIMGSSEGAPLPRVFGRMRIAGQIIWSSNFLESSDTRTVGGKGIGSSSVREFRYSVSVAVALCEGEVIRIGRIWADGQPIDQSTVDLRLHRGTEDQLPDPIIAAIEGPEMAPAYRGTAYVVLEQLDLTPYGNRIPQFSFEVFRRPAPLHDAVPRSPYLDIRGVALVPGTGEYSLATEPVYLDRGKGDVVVTNVHNDHSAPDLKVSVNQLRAELPRVKSTALVVSWFGDDLRCDRCSLQPAVEQSLQDGEPMQWAVSGQTRDTAAVVSRLDGRPVFGGTPADASVIQAIGHLREAGQSVMFYPFILMDIMAGNERTDPWTGAAGQPRVPWRGRITLSAAPGQPNSPDKSGTAQDEVRRFFGTAKATDFSRDGTTVAYRGNVEWSYRRFILHYAHLCAAAGGVDAFCVGSELRSLTQIRDGAQAFPAVRELADLAAEVRAVLGDAVKIGYAADWSEYFGYHPADGTGDVLFHLDELWSHPDIDFVGIDNYMPLSDWRDGTDHLDAGAGSIYNVDYLASNVAGGEGFDWYYPTQEDREKQQRSPITDGAYGEPWIFRYKDLENWWGRAHFNRVGGVREAESTGWRPRSKPIWFTELGCPAVDKGTNQPNVFYDPKSSESFVPYFSTGAPDDLIQYRYLQTVLSHWNDPGKNPWSEVYGGRMVDTNRAHVWAWDARPWPDFPKRIETWVDGSNYQLGHWLNGRASLAPLDALVSEVTGRCGLAEVGVSALHGAVTGFAIGSPETARQSLQPLMLTLGFDSFLHEGTVTFANRDGRPLMLMAPSNFAVRENLPVVSRVRAPVEEAEARFALSFISAERDYQSGAAEASPSDRVVASTSHNAVPIVFTDGQAHAIAERWLAESQTARETISFGLPPSQTALSVGDVFSLGDDPSTNTFRVDRIEERDVRTVEAVRVDPAVYRVPVYRVSRPTSYGIAAQVPAYAELLELPLLTGNEKSYAPYVAVAKQPWNGRIAVFGAEDDREPYELVGEVAAPAVFGTTLDPLTSAVPGLWMPGGIRVRINAGQLRSRSETDVFNGANLAALRWGGAGEWELVQYRSAELVGPKIYRLTDLLRGQAGTDGIMPEEWPAGTDFVAISGAVVQLDLPESARGVPRHYRIGPASRSLEDPSYLHLTWQFNGVGLRPYRPAALNASRRGDGAVELRWIRRTRTGGDSWDGGDVPLGEASERYHVRVRQGEAVVREAITAEPFWSYEADQQALDAARSALSFEVAQVSDGFGPGPYARMDFNG